VSEEEFVISAKPILEAFQERLGVEDTTNCPARTYCQSPGYCYVKVCRQLKAYHLNQGREEVSGPHVEPVWT